MEWWLEMIQSQGDGVLDPARLSSGWSPQDGSEPVSHSVKWESNWASLVGCWENDLRNDTA